MSNAKIPTENNNLHNLQISHHNKINYHTNNKKYFFYSYECIYGSYILHLHGNMVQNILSVIHCTKL